MREVIFEELFSAGLREIVAIDCSKFLLGNYFRVDCVILLLLPALLLFCSMLPGIDLRNGHSAIAPTCF